MAREKCGLWRVHALYLSADSLIYVTSLIVVSHDGYSAHANDKPHMYVLQGDDVVRHVTSLLGAFMSCIVLGTLSIFVVQFNGFVTHKLV